MKNRSNSFEIVDSKWRRHFLKVAGYSTLGLITGSIWPLLNQSAAGPQAKTMPRETFVPDLDISLEAKPDEVDIMPGGATQVWRYHATIHTGNKSRVIDIPGSYLGPMIRAHQGEKIRIRFVNALPEQSIVHWHGLHVPAIMDGHPRHVISQGQTFIYEFVVKNRAGMYWYHPHPHGRTGPQVYRGLAGLFLVYDEQERSLGLPADDYDVSLVLQDRSFDRNNQLVYTSGNRMEQMTGFLGDWILVNGKPDYTLSVSTCAYRLRLLNGSNSRIYKLAWKDGRPLTVIGTDGGLLETPVHRQYLFLAPGERAEIWVDFNDRAVGYKTSLISLPFNTGGMGRGMMGGRMRSTQALQNGAGFHVFGVNVSRQVKESQSLPEKLSDIRPPEPDGASNILNPRKFNLTMGHMQWSINGRVFQMEEVADDEIVQLGSKEIWEFNNSGGGMMHMMNMPHPIHLHGKPFRVLERSGVRHEGYVDGGWKDTVLLMPGEQIRILVEFDEYPGMFLYHCHNLEHEDMGMMRNYFVAT